LRIVVVELCDDRVIFGDDQFCDRAVEAFGGRRLQVAGNRPRDRGHEDRGGHDGQCRDQWPLGRRRSDRRFRTHVILCVVIMLLYRIINNIMLDDSFECKKI